jgi:DNA polymerase III subunit chi
VVKEIVFHIGVTDKFQYACRFLRKAQANSIGVLVVIEKERVKNFSEQLWCISPSDFVAHCLHGSPEEVQYNSNIMLCESVPAATGRNKKFSLLLNLTNHEIDVTIAIEKIIEIVDRLEDDRQLARRRWRIYQQNGLNPISFDVGEATISNA